MSSGGVYSLLCNDGKQDQMLMATEALSRRLAAIRLARKDLPNPNPTIADIEKTHVIFMNAHFKPFAAMGFEYNKVVANNPTLGSKVQFSLPQFGDFFNDMVVHVKVNSPTVTHSGAAVNSDADCALFRWCDFPGERLFQKVSFDVNGNPLDEYYPDTYNVHRQFYVNESKKVGWFKNMGQELPVDAMYKYHDDTQNPLRPKNARASFQHYDGHQTYKQSHEDLEMFIPLLFWFNTDPRLSIPSVCIPYGQRFINIDLATPQQLLRAIINPGALSTSNLTAPVVTTPTFANFDLYINNIFVQPDIHDIYIARVGFSLIRVHRRQVTNVNKASDNIHLQALKWPIETLYIGIRPTANVTSNSFLTSVNNQNSVIDANMSDWHKFGRVTETSVSAANGVNGASTGYLLSKQVGHVSRISLSAQGIPLFNNMPSKFFNSYVPFTYGGWNIKTPEDNGLYMVSFNLYPGTYQPSGHINVSRAREFYFEYTSDYVRSDRTADLVVNAVAINFLLISDGSAALRYAT
jgi:hypothetical protein